MRNFFAALMIAGIPIVGVPVSQEPNPAPAIGAKVRLVNVYKPLNAVTDPEFRGGAAIDFILKDAIVRNQIPGAVVAVGHKGRTMFLHAYGYRSLVPTREEMTLDTIFDIASLTKIVATTSSIMKLVEDGKVRLNDPVTEYIPEYQGGESEITVKHLLTHYSGLRPDVDLKPEWSGYQTGIAKAIVDKPLRAPDVDFTYSDINFLLLGEIVQRVSGKPLPEFAREHIFEPLGMTETTYQPAAGLRARIAPTEQLPGTSAPLRGIVHDPTTRFMDGIAGHAGLFSTIADLSKFAEMMLGMGERDGVRTFSPLTVKTFTKPQSPPGMRNVRGLGWDINSRFSGVRGDLFPVGSYGHTGFTGTSMWIDPKTQSYMILLTNSVHPNVRRAITPLRGRVASAAAAGLPLDTLAAVQNAPKPVTGRVGTVLTGIDVLEAQKFSSLQGKRVGLITNHTGLTKDGRRTVDAMVAGGVNLVALFSPEHGLAGVEDRENIGHARDRATGLRVWSLYTGDKRPTPEMLRGLDLLVFDIQDVGARFYTYICTMRYAMEEAAKAGIGFLVLDRPNPITGTKVEGPMLDSDLHSFVGCASLPLRHGMTVAEVAQLINAELPRKADLQVVRMDGWERADWFDNTSLQWVNPSPNMRSLNAALLYPGIAMLESWKGYSVGRGTDAPFEQVGADWMDGVKLARHLNRRAIPGIRVYPTKFRPTTSNFAGREIEGIRFVITDREVFDSTRFGVELASAVQRLFPGKMNFDVNSKLIGSQQLLGWFKSNAAPDTILGTLSRIRDEFFRTRQPYLLY